MNFFFGFKDNLFSSELTIPKFNFRGNRLDGYKLFAAEPANNIWNVTALEPEENQNFFFVNKNEINNKKIFFLYKGKNLYLRNNTLNELINLDNQFDKEPVQFRSNLKLTYKNEGFSSYQSDYSYNMTTKKGSILSPVSSLLDINAENNFIIFKNINNYPVINNFNYYFICYEMKKILYQGQIKSNFSNKIDVDKEWIKKSVYFFTDQLIGIPIFVSINKGHLSLEHTHPPHQYILSQDCFKIVNSLKKEFNEIINK